VLNGNVVVIADAPTSRGLWQLTLRGIEFATGSPANQTGAYICLSCSGGLDPVDGGFPSLDYAFLKPLGGMWVGGLPSCAGDGSRRKSDQDSQEHVRHAVDRLAARETQVADGRADVERLGHEPTADWGVTGARRPAASIGPSSP
jgi:hypothetical protein